MSEPTKDVDPAEDDVKRKFREALDRKNKSESRGSRHEDGDSPIHQAHGAESTQRTFRRRAGG